MLLFDDPKVCTHDGGNGSQENTETGHEAEEGSSGMDDLPWHHDPTSCDCSDNYSTTDVDVLGEETGHIIGTRDDVGGQIRSDLSHDPAEADEESSSTPRWTFPFRSKFKRVCRTAAGSA